ncbi:MAG TPA: hypothetical protein VL443_06650, partial [Cyclobacteriaceae bacterium]|nr:hypothetical protein [Cyclobacteriaceae bacterium]
SFIFDQALDYLNLKSQKEDISDEVAAFYDREKYIKSLAYHKEQTMFSFLTSSFSFALSLGMLIWGGFGWLDTFLRQYVQQEIVLTLTFFAVLMIVSDILTTPFQLYSTFVIEEKYGFNKTTVKTFVLDKLKGYLLGAIVGGLLITILLYLIQVLGSNFWIWFAFIAAGLFCLSTCFIPRLFCLCLISLHHCQKEN